VTDQPAAGGDVAVLEAACAQARLWGLELDPRYRVLAATVELAPGAGPWHLDVDRRIQVLCSPVSTIIGALRRRPRGGGAHGDAEPRADHGGGGAAAEGIGAVGRSGDTGGRVGAGDPGSDLEPVRFEVEQLVDVSATFGGCLLEPPVFGRPEPRPGRWGPVLALQGRSSAPDGRLRTATFAVADDDARLDVFVRFDDVEVRDAAGNELPLAP
jgi:hypothetical protein